MRPDFSAASRFLMHWLMGLLICTWTSGMAAAENQTEELLIGIEPEHNIFDQVERYRSLAEYLSDQLGVKVNLTIMSRYGEVIKRFRARKLDGAFLSSYTATLGIQELGLLPLVSPVNLNGESTSRGYLLVRNDSGIQDVTDMAGSSMVFVDPATMEGYLFPLAYLHRHGVTDTSSFFHRSYFSGSHASVIFAVLDGRADIGAAKDTVFRKLVSNDPTISQELRVIAESPQVPEVTLCVRSELDRDLREKLGAVLLYMEKTSRGKKVLKEFEALRFIKTGSADFDKVEEMALEAEGTDVE